MNYKGWLNRKDLEYRNGILYFAEMNTVDLAVKFGTPIYVINEKLIRKRYHQLSNALDSVYKNNDIHFAVKANSNLTVLKILHSEGAKFDCTSTGEIYSCLKAGITPEKIIYTGNMFTNEDFEFAVKNRIVINLDSISQLNRLINIYEQQGVNKSEYNIISFRINPEFGAGHHTHTITAGKEIKFGILDNQIIKAYQKAQKVGFEKFGIHMHIGSGIINSQDFQKASEKYLSIIKNLTHSLKIKLEFIDFGGGLGIPYRPEEDPLDLELYKEYVIKPFNKMVSIEDIGNPIFKIEPGRYLSAESSIILTQVNTIKDNGYKLFAGVNAGFNTLIRPTMYGSYHHIIACIEKDKEKQLIYDIVGPICESGDILGRNREFPELKEEDYLAILDVGAYGFVMSSQYNSRPRPAEILIRDEKSYIIRKAESFEDLLQHQFIPDHLK